MNNHLIIRPAIVACCCTLGLSLLFLGSGKCLAVDEPAQVVRVEEDWEMVLGTPEPENDAPQVACVISSTGDVNSLHAAFNLNHRSLPEYVAGGLQLQIWDGETPRLAKIFPNDNIMSQTGETVTWTQAMELKDGKLTFDIVNGESSTWGQFGGQGYLKDNIDTSLTNLNQYSPDVSVRNSGISFASNRVQSLTLKRVRLVLATGEILEDNNPRTVYAQEQ